MFFRAVSLGQFAGLLGPFLIKKEARCSDVTSRRRANITVTLGEGYPEIEEETVPGLLR